MTTDTVQFDLAELEGLIDALKRGQTAIVTLSVQQPDPTERDGE